MRVECQNCGERFDLLDLESQLHHAGIEHHAWPEITFVAVTDGGDGADE